MKKIFACALFALMWTAACADVKTPLSADELPAEAKTYVKTYFPESSIVKVIRERDLFGDSYEVALDNRIELTFDNKGKVKELDGNDGVQLPDAVVPSDILAYVKAKFPNAYVTSWELDSRRQKVELNTDIDLEFDLKGNFIRIDD